MRTRLLEPAKENLVPPAPLSVEPLALYLETYFRVAASKPGRHTSSGGAARSSVEFDPSPARLPDADGPWRIGVGVTRSSEVTKMADSSVSTRATVVPMLAYEDAGAAPSSGSSARLVSTSKSTCVVATEVAEQRIAAALAAGGTVVDESNAPSLTVI